MFLFEMSALGYEFAVTRWIADVAGVIIISALIDRLMSIEEKKEIYQKHAVEF
jgi:hypothetical protein